MPQQNGVLVVTGGSRGIGAATCLLGADRGYKVVVNYASNVEAAERVCAQIHAKGGVKQKFAVASLVSHVHCFRHAPIRAIARP